MKNNLTKLQDFHISTSRDETFLISCQKTTGHMSSRAEPIENSEKKEHTHGFLHCCQPPACQGIPVATTDRSEWTQCHDYKTGKPERTKSGGTKQSQADREGEKIFYDTMNVAKQREGSSGQHLADFRHFAICCP